MHKNEKVQRIPVDKLAPNRWGAAVNPPLSPDDHDALLSSIKEVGVQTPLIAWKNNGSSIVVAGNTRLKIARKLKLQTVPVILRTFNSETDAKLFAITDNVARRQMTTAQKAEMALSLVKILSVGRGKRTDLELSPEMNKVDAWDEAARRVGVSILQLAEKMGMKAVDLFILQQVSPLPAQHKQQRRARRNHSYLWILEREKKKG